MRNKIINFNKVRPKDLNSNVSNMLHMEQRVYEYEIVLNLIRDQSHLRKIAKDLNINHMTIKRNLDNLLKENIIDVKQEGKNNVFSMKKTLEARNFIFISELYKLSKFIKNHPELKQSILELKKLHAKLILIFGSYASETETKNSDLDVYIETESNELKKNAEKINSKFSVKIGIYNKKNLLIKEIEKNHVIVKGVEEFYERNEFFD